MAVRKYSKGSRRKRKDKGLLGIGILSASILVAAFILAKQRSPVVEARESTTVVAEYDTVPLPVPSEYVPAGTKVSEIRFESVSFPKHQIPKGALHDLGPILNATTIAPLPARLPLFRTNFSLKSRTNPVIEKIPEGMRAMTIRVDATSAVEGWAGSGAIIDVLLVQKDRTSVVAENVKILSAERSVAPVDGEGSPSVPSTVTVLVTQEQCLAINTAIPLGKIAFALRGISDENSWSDVTYEAGRLKRGPASGEGQSSISGYVSVDGKNGKRTFALADGKWIKTEVKPQGFLVAGE